MRALVTGQSNPNLNRMPRMLHLDRAWRWITQHPLPACVLLSLLSIGAFLLYATAADVAPGFPLDDAWIHQTYARNLGQLGQFAYVADEPSAGSTSPLWTLLISVSYATGIPYRAWTLFLGWLALVGTSAAARRLSLRILPNREALALLVGLFCCLEWHLVWAAVSGMETLAFCSIGLTLLVAVTSADKTFRRALRLGLGGGALILIRPEGVVLVALLVLYVYYDTIVTMRSKLRWALSLRGALRSSAGIVAGAFVWLLPYFAFNVWVSGTLMPNTFYAKQAEYLSLIEGWSLPVRWARVVTPTLAGAQVLLFPGFIWAAVVAVPSLIVRDSKRHLAKITPAVSLPLAYWLITTLLYAVRLPVTYQHGRYLMPTIPLLTVVGASGMALLVEKAHRLETRRLVTTAIVSAITILLLVFIGLGASAYARDVAFINDEMVAVAAWVNEHTPPNALVAAHDIGAIGYFARRPLLDLAGLVTPEVVPIMRDESALLAFMQEQHADYLVTFPSWYPSIVASPAAQRIFQTDCTSTREMGHDNMAVYALRRE